MNAILTSSLNFVEFIRDAILNMMSAPLACAALLPMTLLFVFCISRSISASNILSNRGITQGMKTPAISLFGGRLVLWKKDILFIAFAIVNSTEAFQNMLKKGGCMAHLLSWRRETIMSLALCRRQAGVCGDSMSLLNIKPVKFQPLPGKIEDSLKCRTLV